MRHLANVHHLNGRLPGSTVRSTTVYNDGWSLPLPSARVLCWLPLVAFVVYVVVRLAECVS